jgi:flagellar biosynthesis chaperone FliJ
LSFTFPLEALLAQRRVVESARRQRFAELQQHADETRQRLQQLESDFATRVSAWDPDRVRSLAELEKSIAGLRAAAARYEPEVSEARAALLEAMRDRKALELLKKRRLAGYAAREARKEERELDEANQASCPPSHRAAVRSLPTP